VVEPVTAASVKLYDRPIGAVVWDDTRRVGIFEYTAEFIASGFEPSPLRLATRPGQYQFPELSRSETFHGLPGLLADALPDAWGSELLRIAVERQGRSLDDLNPVERLCYVGDRAMGAVTFEPSTYTGGTPDEPIDVSWLAQIASEIVAERGTFRARMETDGIAELIQLGTSAGGARAKALVAWNRTSGEIRSGQVEIPDGYEHWLLKFDGSTGGRLGDPQGFGLIEYAYYQMATNAGVTMAESTVYEDSDGRSHFMTKRFDRTAPNQRVHTHTLGGIGHYDFNQAGHSYETALRTAIRLNLGHAELDQLYRRMVFNVIARNQDDHVKNLSFTMDRTGGWHLSPAYDIIWAYNPNGPWTARHQMSVNGRSSAIKRTDLLAVADQFGIQKANDIIGEVVNVVKDWNRYAADNHVDQEQALHIKDTLRTDI